MDRQIDRRMDLGTDRWTDRKDGWTEREMEGQTDIIVNNFVD